VKRFSGIIVALIGVAIPGYGYCFRNFRLPPRNKMVADEVLVPLALSDVNAQYDACKCGYNKYMAAEQPNISAGKAAPTVMYDYFGAQKGITWN